MNSALRNYALVKRINGVQDPELERLVNEEEENKRDEVDHKIRDFARYVKEHAASIQQKENANNNNNNPNVMKHYKLVNRIGGTEL